MLILNRLPQRQRAEMITHVTGGKALPKEMARQIIDRTDGVPLFIEELTKAVIESGVLVDSGDRYTATGPVAPLAIPTSLHASLLARLDRLAPTREVAQIGAALGRQFSHGLISAVAVVPQQQLDSALAQLVDAELIFRRGAPPDAEYVFKHALVQDAAYSTLLKSRRQQIHARIVTTLESQFPEIVTTQPALLAQHCTEAGLTNHAISYWLKAGQQSVARSAMKEAVTQLEKGLNLLPTLPEGPRRQQQELDLLITLGPALMASSGYGARRVGEIYVQARTLAEQLDRADCLIPLLAGQQFYHMFRAEWRVAQTVTPLIEKIATERNDVATLLYGRHCEGMIRFHLGEFVTANAFFQQCQVIREPAHRAALGTLLPQDPYVNVLAWMAITLTHLGFVEEGRERVTEGLSEARRLEHVYSHAFMLIFAAWSACTARSAQEARHHAEELVSICEEHGFPHWWGWGNCSLGRSLVMLGRAQEGINSLRKGLSAVRATGAVTSTPVALLWLAEAEQVIDATDERTLEAELYRLRGDVLNCRGDQVAAEENYRRALAVAKRQSANIFELRAAKSLAYLWHDQSKRAEARNLLTPIHGWFPESLEILDLKEAKELLQSLR
jgi:tetratricopeptide (TPR) repeat protein